MKIKRARTLLAIALISFASFNAIACSPTGGDDDSSSQMGDITLAEKSHEMLFGETYEIVAKISSDEDIVWTSSDPNVASVDNGSVIAVGKGEAIITASIGASKATCLIKVGFGSFLPSLKISNVPNDEIFLPQGASFALAGEALFNGGNYPCSLSVKLAEDSCVSFSGNALRADKPGETYIDIKGNWYGFENSAMGKRLKVTVSRNVSLYSEVTINGQSKVMNSLELEVLDSWGGVSYNTQANVTFYVNDDGYLTTAELLPLEEDIVTVSENGLVTAKKVGTTRLYASYQDEEGTVYTAFIEIIVSCPLATYEGQLRLSTEIPFPLAKYFGADAILSYVKQGDKELSFTSNGIIRGLVAAGEDSDPLLILTNKGGYYFKDAFVYTRALDADNFASSFLLSSGNVIDGYYILDDDIDETVDMTSQISSYYAVGSDKNCYFKGTFDGQGHSVKAKVGRDGIFGGLGEKAVIKNTHFEFTFSSDGYCSGLARNNYTNNIKNWRATVSNLYVTTTNYYDHSYALFEMRFNDMSLKDIYVDLTLSSSCKEVTAATQEKGALFRVDNTMTHGPSSQFSGDFQNIYVVSGVFMPISSGYFSGVTSVYASYANNDANRLGDYEHAGNSLSSSYCVIGSKEDNPQKSLFGNIPSATWFFPATNNTILAYVYFASSKVSNGGVKRFDTNAELRSSGVSKVGSWETKGA